MVALLIKKIRLIDVIKEGDILYFISGKNYSDPDFNNIYAVLEPDINNKIKECVKQTKVKYLDSLNDNCIGREVITDFTHYYLQKDGYFYSNNETRDKQGNISWKSTGRIEISSENNKISRRSQNVVHAQ